MRLTWAAAAAALALWSTLPGNVRAEAVNPNEDDNVVIGIGIICNTSDQMRQLVSQRIGGAEIDHAIRVVNNGAKDPRACGIAAVAFLSDKMVDMKSVNGKLVQIVRINVLAAFDGKKWSRINGMTQYALIEPEGYAI